jgi:hypothetical protein
MIAQRRGDLPGGGRIIFDDQDPWHKAFFDPGMV